MWQVGDSVTRYQSIALMSYLESGLYPDPCCSLHGHIYNDWLKCVVAWEWPIRGGPPIPDFPPPLVAACFLR